MEHMNGVQMSFTMLEKYDMQLPEEFIEHVMQNKISNA
jgi:hypothetical protein